MATQSRPEGFGHFFRRYTKTWMHAVATAGLTAFGALTFVHRGFVVLALACYVVPPIVLYVSRSRGESANESTSPTEAALSDRDGSAAGTESASVTEPEIEAERESDPDPAPEREPASERDREPATERGQTSAGERKPDAESPETAPEQEPDDESDAEPRWQTVDAPTDATLLDTAVADSSAIAVGEGGIVLRRNDDEGWGVLLEDGPAAQGQTLRGAGATDDGETAWIAGDGGAVGRLEVESGRHADYSAPDDRTDNLAGLAVAGASSDETVLLITGSGEIVRGRYREGDLEWDAPVKPGGGSSLSGVALADEDVGYCCDTNDGVFETVDGGRAFETVGLEGSDGTLTDVAAGGLGDCHASADAGVVHRYDGSTWAPERVCDGGLSAIARHDDRLVVCGADGAVYERDGPTADWERFDAGPGAGLEGVAVGAGRSVAVGANGTVVERR